MQGNFAPGEDEDEGEADIDSMLSALLFEARKLLPSVAADPT